MTELTRRGFVQASAAGAAFSSGLLSARAATGKKPPNIVYLFSDTHRWGALPFTQTPSLKTPNMERMLERGVCMDRCYSNLPICTPYRAILMTGRWPWQQGLIANHMQLEDRVDI
ncbi:MAG: sulfatase-like hydrolase/transferase, partial [Kiritimatiellales bacterium]|nr:sulfatase-like hydrolase/transferase [Kiritimatiellales bacterium]